MMGGVHPISDTGSYLFDTHSNVLPIFSTDLSLTSCVFFSVGLSSIMRNFQQPKDLLKISHYRRKSYRKENTTIEWDDGGKIGNKINNSN